MHVQGETTVPTNITMFGMSGGKWNLIEIPQSILDLSPTGQLAALPELMHRYLRKYNDACPFFGMVTGFRFVRLIDYFQFGADGVLVGQVDKPFRRGVASISFA